ncbi:hypothetical protein NT6N_18570 [Oceaniferula spumae]|uniref:Uncharacterized protein n=1 Tax=Oceaniferula spumae TaxID=2979115 RepID=A0AAT9FL33_9BACT
MNKITLNTQAFLHAAKSSSSELIKRVSCFLRRENFQQHDGPQWQQLELPFTRTPLKKWNR